MAPHHTKDKGDLAVAKVISDLVERGALVLLPLTEHAPFDLVAYLSGDFHRVQVKYRTATRGAVSVRFESFWADRHGVHTRAMPRDEVDVIAIYCPDTDTCYYIDPSRFGMSVTVRIEPPKNNQQRRVISASECLSMPPSRSGNAVLSGG
ncbi:MAG TPA: group I intron-associated PD-(D/E)XK endonuclease [Ilumatobacter sp.]|nr:group I intron-associated PD-(D/E)XK endonuclease [Ilumatobacter sp.]